MHQTLDPEPWDHGGLRMSSLLKCHLAWGVGETRQKSVRLSYGVLWGSRGRKLGFTRTVGVRLRSGNQTGVGSPLFWVWSGLGEAWKLDDPSLAVLALSPRHLEGVGRAGNMP